MMMRRRRRLSDLLANSRRKMNARAWSGKGNGSVLLLLSEWRKAWEVAIMGTPSRSKAIS